MARKAKVVRLRDRKRGTDPRRTQRAYLQELREKHMRAARRRDPKAFDEYWARTYLELFPS